MLPPTILCKPLRTAKRDNKPDSGQPHSHATLLYYRFCHDEEKINGTSSWMPDRTLIWVPMLATVRYHDSLGVFDPAQQIDESAQSTLARPHYKPCLSSILHEGFAALLSKSRTHNDGPKLVSVLTDPGMLRLVKQIDAS